MGSFSVKPYKKIDLDQYGRNIEEEKPVLNSTLHPQASEALKSKEIGGNTTQFASILQTPLKNATYGRIHL